MTAAYVALDLVAVLAEHQRLLDGPGSCRCGAWPPTEHNIEWPAHLAEQVERSIAARVAEAGPDMSGEGGARRELAEGIVYATLLDNQGEAEDVNAFDLARRIVADLFGSEARSNPPGPGVATETMP